jgi:hypothetical protein
MRFLVTGNWAENEMRSAVAIAALALGVGAGHALADDASYTCTKGDAVRTIAVMTRPASGLACDVRYDKEQSAPETLWHAAHDASFCFEHAKKFVDHLSGAGWTCAQGDNEAAANSALPAPYAAPVSVAKTAGASDDERGDASMPAASGMTAATRATPAVGTAPTLDPNIQLRGSIR